MFLRADLRNVLSTTGPRFRATAEMRVGALNRSPAQARAVPRPYQDREGCAALVVDTVVKSLITV